MGGLQQSRGLLTTCLGTTGLGFERRQWTILDAIIQSHVFDIRLNACLECPVRLSGGSSRLLRRAMRRGQALALSESLDTRQLVAHCHLGPGKLYQRSGKQKRARENLTAATTLYRDMDLRFWLVAADVETCRPQ